VSILHGGFDQRFLVDVFDRDFFGRIEQFVFEVAKNNFVDILAFSTPYELLQEVFEVQGALRLLILLLMLRLGVRLFECLVVLLLQGLVREHDLHEVFLVQHPLLVFHFFAHQLVVDPHGFSRVQLAGKFILDVDLEEIVLVVGVPCVDVLVQVVQFLVHVRERIGVRDTLHSVVALSAHPLHLVLVLLGFAFGLYFLHVHTEHHAFLTFFGFIGMLWFTSLYSCF